MSLVLVTTAVASPPTTWPAIPHVDATRATANRDREHIGDDPDNGGAAADLSADLKPEVVAAAMRKVADWELTRAEKNFANTWTWVPLYSGLLETARITGDTKYREPLKRVAEKYQWKLGRRLEHADDHAIGQLYLDLYFLEPDAKRIEATRAQFDQLIAKPDDKWTWCDALYMGPPVWARLVKASGEQKYLDYLDKNWWATSEKLYDADEHLFFRDGKYLAKRGANGKKIFWSRGNGWVMGGLVRVLQFMPDDYPDRPKFIAMLKDMSAKLVSIQDAEGSWHASLLERADYPLPENSGSALITYGLAYGVNEGILDRATFEPAVAKAWKGLLSCVYADGRLGCVQQTGEAPAFYKPTASYNYGVGGFLLAGSEVHRLASANHP